MASIVFRNLISFTRRIKFHSPMSKKSEENQQEGPQVGPEDPLQNGPQVGPGGKKRKKRKKRAKKKHGGARAGSGRPPIPEKERAKPLTLSFNQEDIDWLDGWEGSRSEIVRMLISFAQTSGLELEVTPQQKEFVDKRLKKLEEQLKSKVEQIRSARRAKSGPSQTRRKVRSTSKSKQSAQK